MIDLSFKQLWLTIMFFIIFSTEKYLTLTICPAALWRKNATTVAGSQSGESGDGPSMFYWPTDLYVDDNNTIYVLDTDNYRVQRFLSNSTIGTTVINGSGGSSLIPFGSMDAISVDLSGNIYILDSDNARVTKWTPGFINGTIVAGSNGTGNNTNQLNSPYGMFIELNTSIIWIADTSNNRIVRWESPSTVVIVCGSYGVEANQFNNPYGLFVDESDSNTFYVADTNNHRIQMWRPGATNGTTVAGQTGYDGSELNQLWYPQALLVDTNGYMYIVDNGNARIMRWLVGSTSGMIIAGSSIEGTLSDQLFYPYNIRFDSSGDLLVADTGNNRIQKISVSCARPTTTTTTTIISRSSTVSTSTKILTTTTYFNSSSTLSLFSTATTTNGSFASVDYYPKWSLMIFCSIMIIINN